jgi:tryptophan-specific transport protein
MPVNLTKSSSVFFLIIGTAIGAGMVTLPILCQNLSLLSIVLLFSVSLSIMQLSAYYFVELSTASHEQENLLSFILRYEKNLYWPTKLIYLLFFWSLLAVYLTTLPIFFHELAPTFTLLKEPAFYGLSLILFLLTPLKTQGVVNKLFVIIMLFLLGWILFIGLTRNQQMISIMPVEFKINALLPIMMFFGYHLTIPSLTRYVPEKALLNKICLIAGITILAIYLAWSVIMLNLIQAYQVKALRQDFMKQIAELVQNNTLAQFSALFSVLAMGTSCMGMSLGTKDFLQDAYTFLAKNHLLSVLLTVLPSLFMVYEASGNYLKLLHLASYFALYLLVILPSWLIFKKRQKNRIVPLIFCCFTTLIGINASIGYF